MVPMSPGGKARGSMGQRADRIDKGVFVMVQNRQRLELIAGGKDAAPSINPIHQIAEDLQKLIKASEAARCEMLSYLLDVALDEALRESQERER